MSRILVADDTKNIRMMITTFFEIQGDEVIEATNGKEAMDIFQNQQFDIAFLDIKMPEISGTEVLRRIRAKGINTPVVIMTAFATVKNAVECTKLGAVAYLQKPFTTDRLKTTLNEFTSLKCENDDINDLVNQAKEELSHGNLEDSLKDLKYILSKDPNNGEVYFLLAKVYEGYGLVEESNRFKEVSKLFSYGK